MIYNQLKTMILLGGLTSLLIFFGGLLGGHGGIKAALLIAFLMNSITYFFSDKIVLALYGARPLDKKEFAWIYEIVEELTTHAQMPMPTLWFVPTEMSNAFATGRSPAHASVAVTQGILKLLDARELRGVLAHEISHVKNRDILVGTIAATLAMAIGYLADWARWSFFWGGGSSRRDENGRGIGIFGVILISVLVPLAATLIQLAITRSREYLADESGAQCCDDPLALADALEKLQYAGQRSQHTNPTAAQAATASLFIVYPFSSKGMFNLFSTHPPLEKRIAKLREMAKAKMR